MQCRDRIKKPSLLQKNFTIEKEANTDTKVVQNDEECTETDVDYLSLKQSSTSYIIS